MSVNERKRLNFRFRPSLTMTLVVLVVVPLFVALGFWQYGRAEQKRLLQEEYDRRGADATVSIGPEPISGDDLRFYRVAARGYYETDYQFLIDNRILHGRVGYHVITPLRLHHSELRVLVNRGWIPLGEDRQQLPVIETPTGPQNVTGVATVPAEPGFMLGEPPPLSEGWQPVWQQLDLQRFIEHAPYRVQPVVILLAADSAAGGFTREWVRLDTGIAVHQGYAFQWFVLAAAMTTFYIVLGLRGAHRKKTTSV